MKKFILLTAIVLGTFNSIGQVFSSSCIAPDSIIAKYKDDADRLALRKIYQQNLSFKDSIRIPVTHSDTVLNALIAVYNATTLQARDTVISIFNIHTFPNPLMNSFYVAADSNLTWMQQLKNENIPTGNSTIDNLISKYDLYIGNYYTNYYLHSWHTVRFVTDSNYNLPPLINLFDTISGVTYAEPNGVCCDGNNITALIYANHIELIYSYGWGDCPSGCLSRRFWKFNVYFDCSVEYVGSYGSPLTATGVKEIEKNIISIRPNPFNDIIRVEGITQPVNYTISNLLGEILIKGQSSNNSITDCNTVKSGIYILTLQIDEQIITHKIIKE